MRPAHNFTELPGPDDMAACALKHLANKDYRQAAAIALEASVNTTGNAFFETNSLAAISLAKAGYPQQALEYWDKIVRSSPQKFNYLEAALHYAWQIENDCPDAKKYAQDWQNLLTRVFIVLPPAALLWQCKQRGCQSPGSIGIHQGKLMGWLFLPKDQKANIRIGLTQHNKFTVRLQPIAQVDDFILYKIEEDLPENCGQFSISICDAANVAAEGSPVICSPAKSRKLVKQKMTPNAPVNILVPVYDGRKETLQCIAFLLKSLKFNETPANIFVVWDNGPNTQLLDDLKHLQAKGRLKLSINTENLGFLASVNTALNQIDMGDVLLLNADTLVHGNWLDRMAAAGNRENVATVTALSNEAELMSFPSPFDRGKISSWRQARLLDNAAAGLEPDKALQEIPVGVGFCMLIKRRALAKLGGLDGHYLFRGYGEEVDFCLRAKKIGLRNLGAFNVFVAHLGEKSFGLSKKALAAQNNAAIHARFPKYHKDYESILHSRTNTQLRNQISKNALSFLPSPRTLQIRPWTDRLLPPWLKNDKTIIPPEPQAAMFLRPGPAPRAILRVWCDVPLTDMFFCGQKEFEELKELLANLHCEAFKTYDCSIEILEIAASIIQAPMEQAEPDKLLQPIPASMQPQTFLCAPPQTLAAWKELRDLAIHNPLTRFMVFQLGYIWPYIPRPKNMLNAPPADILGLCDADGFILPGGKGEIGAWRAWLQANNCGRLPMYNSELK